MAFSLDYEMKKNIVRILTILAGLYCIMPEEMAPLSNYAILGFLYPRWIFGGAAILFAFGSFRKWW